MPFPNPAASIPLTKRLRPYSTDPLAHEISISGVGSLQSYYEQGVESEPPLKKHEPLPHPNKGAGPLFGWLDVMPGAASAPNQDIWAGSGLDTNISLPRLDNAAIDFQLILGKYTGYRLSWDSEYKVAENAEEKITKEMKPVFMDDYNFQNQTVFKHEAQASHGMHYIDPVVNQEAATYASRFRVGFELESHARHAGLERGENPANNTSSTTLGDEYIYHNPLTMEPNVPGVIPMELDTIRINDELVRPEDTAVALGGNNDPGMGSSTTGNLGGGPTGGLPSGGAPGP